MADRCYYLASLLISVVVWTSENDTKTISVDANRFENGAKRLRFRLKTDSVDGASVNNAGFLQFKQVDKPSLCMIVNSSQQEIIKVRERIPHVGSLTKVICPQLFLDMVPSFSEDVTRAMRGQPR